MATAVLKTEDGKLVENKLYCGNCFDLFRQLDDDSVDCVFTSPPYNRKRNDKYAFYNDALADYWSFLDELVTQSMRVARKHVFLNIQSTYYNSREVYRLFGKYERQIRQNIIWHKTNPMPASGKNVTNSYEYFVVFGDKPLKSNFTYTSNFVESSVYSGMSSEHHAMMHPDVADWMISRFTHIGDLVLDPCMGLGTTALACMSNKRKFIGFELSEKYHVMSLERIRGDFESRVQVLPFGD